MNLFADPSPPRRTIYGFIDRLNLPGLFRAFDFPSPDATSAQRDITTVAPQALYLMNSPFAIQTAQKLMIRPEIAAEREFGPRIQRLYELLFSRLPTPQELQSAEEFFGDKTAREDPANWARYAQALLLTNEFAFVD